MQSVVVDPRDRLWIVDTGSIEFGPTSPGGPKLVGVDLATNKVFKTITFPPEVALPTTYLNDVRFDLRRGEAGYAFLTDSSDKGPNGLIVVDLATGRSWRRLHDHPSTKADPAMLALVEGRPVMERPPGGQPKPVTMGSDGIAIAHDGSRLYYCPLVSRRLYSVSVDALVDGRLTERRSRRPSSTTARRGPPTAWSRTTRGGSTRPTTSRTRSSAACPTGQYETLVHDPRVLWPDTLSVARDGYLYFTANQLHRQARYHEGKDLRQKPYVLFRVRIDARAGAAHQLAARDRSRPHHDGKDDRKERPGGPSRNHRHRPCEWNPP